MANVLIGFPNRIDSSTLSQGAWVPTLPLDNLKNRLFARVARSVDTDPESTTFTADLGEPRRIQVFALVNHNMSLTARVHIEAATQPSFDPQYLVLDRTDDAWGSLVNSAWLIDELEWEGQNYWTGTYSKEDLAGLTSISSIILPGQVSARYWRVTILDEDNPDGYLQVGRAFFGGAISPSRNYSYGASLGFDIATTVETALGGAEFFDVREPVRVFRFTLNYLRDAEAYGNFLELVRRAGLHSEVFVVPDPDDFGNAQRRNFMGRIRQATPLEQAAWIDGGISNSMGFEIKELR